MKHFVTLFLPAQNVHLVKDVGQIPYQMQRHFGYKSTLMCYKNGQDYPYLDDEVKGLNLEFLEDEGSTLFWEKSAIKYLWHHARDINVLNLYHLTQASMLYGLIYKYRNPEGIFYLKLDMNINTYKKYGIRFSESKWKNAIHKKIFKLFLKKVDIVSVETEQGRQLIKTLNKKLFAKTILIPNGIDAEQVKKYLPDNMYAPKEDIILTVGRIGAPAKNSELLLRALGSLNLEGWKVLFVGPVMPEFKSTIIAFFEKHPDKKGHVIFEGAVTDRAALFSYYIRAKIFCLSSRREGFPTVFCEAQAGGNYIIGTDTISCIDEVTHHGKWGTIIESDNARQLQNALARCMEEDFYDISLMKGILRHARKYYWHSVLEKLNRHIEQILHHPKAGVQ